MITNPDVSNSVCTMKKCAFCHNEFHSKSHSSRYCSTSCKTQFFKEKNKNQRWYNIDPNRGKTFPLGTVTSWEIPEDKLVFTGGLDSLIRKLSEFISPEQLAIEMACIIKLKPYSETGEWVDSSVQIFADKNFMEVFWISPEEYKFYVWTWENDDERQFK